MYDHLFLLQRDDHLEQTQRTHLVLSERTVVVMVKNRLLDYVTEKNLLIRTIARPDVTSFLR